MWSSRATVQTVLQGTERNLEAYLEAISASVSPVGVISNAWDRLCTLQSCIQALDFERCLQNATGSRAEKKQPLAVTDRHRRATTAASFLRVVWIVGKPGLVPLRTLIKPTWDGTSLQRGDHVLAIPHGEIFLILRRLEIASWNSRWPGWAQACWVLFHASFAYRLARGNRP